MKESKQKNINNQATQSKEDITVSCAVVSTLTTTIPLILALILAQVLAQITALFMGNQTSEQNGVIFYTSIILPFVACSIAAYHYSRKRNSRIKLQHIILNALVTVVAIVGSVIAIALLSLNIGGTQPTGIDPLPRMLLSATIVNGLSFLYLLRVSKKAS